MNLFEEGIGMKEDNDLEGGAGSFDAVTPTQRIAETGDDSVSKEDDVMTASWDGAIYENPPS